MMSYENWKHILGVFSFQNLVYNGILVIKHKLRDPQPEQSHTSAYFDALFNGDTSHYQITTPFSYHHRSELASALPSPPQARSYWLELSQPAPPRPWKHPSHATATIFLPDLFLNFFTTPKAFYTFELDLYIWFVGNRVAFCMV